MQVLLSLFKIFCNILYTVATYVHNYYNYLFALLSYIDIYSYIHYVHETKYLHCHIDQHASDNYEFNSFMKIAYVRQYNNR